MSDVWWLVKNVFSGETADGRSLGDTMMVRQSLLDILGANIASVCDESKVTEKEERE